MSDTSTSALPFTGERFAPEVSGAIWYEHWHRYCVVQPLAKGLAVLDAACGEGYGSYLLAQGAREVVGIDIAPEAIAHARARYAAPNLRYEEGSCAALPLADASIDLIVSFETIEHLWEQAEMLAEFRRVLAPDGALVISSPNQPIYSEFGAHVNDFHVRELTRDELAALLDPVFPQQRWYAQRMVAHSALWEQSDDPAAARTSALLTLGDGGAGLAVEPGPPMYFVVVCAAANARLPALPPLSLFDDGRQSLYGDYLRALLREKQLYWEELDARKIAEDRLAELISVTNAHASERQKTAALNERVAAAEEAYGAVSESLKKIEASLDAAESELAVEREYAAGLVWEERNARNVAEQRLAELITTVNALSSEREKAATLEGRVAALDAALASAQNDLAAERERASTLMWEERNSRHIAEERLSQLVALAGELGKAAELRGRLPPLEQALATTKGQLTGCSAALAESQSRLAFRETLVGWLRWPLSRLKPRARATS